MKKILITIITIISLICFTSCQKSYIPKLNTPTINDSLPISKGSFVFYNTTGDSGTLVIHISDFDTSAVFHTVVIKNSNEIYRDSFKLVNFPDYAINFPFDLDSIMSANIYIVSTKYNYQLVDTLN